MGSDCLIIEVEASSRETVQICCVQDNPCYFEERTGRKEVLPQNQNGREEAWWRWVIEKDCTPVDGKDQEGEV
jgi:hypothetical protein